MYTILGRAKKPNTRLKKAHKVVAGKAGEESMTRKNSARALLKSALLLGASVMAFAGAAYAQDQSKAAPEEVIVTGSLIRGTSAVGVPITSLGAQDFKEVGALTVADLLKSEPSILVQGSFSVANSGGDVDGLQRVSIHNIGGHSDAPKTLLLIDGMRIPVQGSGNTEVDPSIIPALALDRIDVLPDGASATYGSDAVAGVINVVLRRGYDGAISQFRIQDSTGIGGLSVMGSQLYGKKWDSGDVTVTYEYYHIQKVQGPARDYFSMDYSQAGFDNRTPLFSAEPGIASVGGPKTPAQAPSGFNAKSGTTCNNCYSIPTGQNGVGLTWAQILANPGVANEINPYSEAWVLPDVTRNAFAMTFDQDLWEGGGFIKKVQFSAEGFYNNRRNIAHSASSTGATDTNAFIQAIPTSNPFYPVGAPAGLQVAYDIGRELQGRDVSGSVTGRYEGELNFDLASNWEGKVFYQKTEDQNQHTFLNMVNPNLLNAAVGNTVASNGVAVAFTKPANIPYLNLFCDSTAFQCNDPATLAYIRAMRSEHEREAVDQTGINFDGPVLDLPGGPLRAAVGGVYVTDHWTFSDISGANSQLGDSAPSMDIEGEGRQVWSVFGQTNVPIVGKDNAIPLVQSLELELSGRLDHYSDVGSTKNYKIAVNWTVGEGFSLRGALGTSFRAPLFWETSTQAVIQSENVVAGAGQNGTPTCPVVGVPAVRGSAAAILDPQCTAALQFLGGIFAAGGSGIGQAIRPPGYHLSPETSRNWALGFDFLPTDGFLRGLDVNATFYNVKITGLISAVSGGSGLDDPLATPAFILNTNPNFANYVANLLHSSHADPTIIASGVSFIQDGAVTNVGWTLWKGIDFSGSYDWDMAELGVWNAGITGSYALQRQTLNVVGGSVFDAYKGQDSGGRLNYRVRLGWTEPSPSAWSVTGFMNYHAHWGANEVDQDHPANQVLPPACFMIGNAACNASGLPQFAQYTQQYPLLTLYEPAFITFDLSVGYNTGERPADPYLQNLAFQLTIDDVTDRPPNFKYSSSTHGGSPSLFNDRYDPSQRVVIFTISKVW